MVEDSPEDTELLERHLRISGSQVSIDRVANSFEMREALANRDYDVVIADYSVPGFGAIPALKLLKQSGRDIPFIILSGTISEETAVAAMRAGAHDYVLKGNLARLLPAVEREIQEAAARHQKRQMEAALHQAGEAINVREARLQGIIGSAMDAIISVNDRQRIVVFNQAAEKMFGCPAIEALGSSLDRFLPPQYREIHYEHIRQFGAAGITSRSMHSPGILNALRSNGEVFPIEATISQVQAGGEKLFTVILRDITERKRTEEALRQSEERLRAMYLHAAVGIEQVGKDGRLLMVNPAFRSLLGYSESEMLGKTSKEISHPEDREREARMVASMLDGKRDFYALEKRYLHKDGSPVWASVTSSLIKDAAGQPLSRVTIIQDIAERKRAELLEAQLQQSQKLESLGQLAGAVAHDFNTLLNIMLGYAGLLLHELPRNDPRRARVEQIEASAQSAAQLTRQLLAFSRKQAFVPQVIDLRRTVEGLQPMLQRLLPEDIQVDVQCSPEPCPIKVDPGQMQQVVLNLATNARDAMPQGGKLTIEVSTVELSDGYAQRHAPMASGRYQMVAVSDTGSGMNSETQAHMFEPFFTTKPPGKGTGLGLSTIYGIVKQSGGDIWVYSEPGLGSIFKVYLPRSSDPIEDAEPLRPPSPNVGGNETILLVEDSGPLRQLTRELLTQVGYVVLEASDGLDAIRLSQAHQGEIHLLLTDVVMPKMRGPEVAMRIVKQRPHTAIILLSGYTEEAVSQMENAGRMTLIEKPFTADTLLQTVRQLLDDIGAPS
jgi:PAS domain S-box-containing protein